MEGKIKMWIIGSIVGVLILFGAYVGMRKVVVPWMTDDYVQEQVEKAVMEKDAHIKDLNKRISVLGKQVFESQKRYANLRAMIAQKVKEAESIKVPETKDEIIKRFTDLDYPPQP